MNDYEALLPLSFRSLFETCRSQEDLDAAFTPSVLIDMIGYPFSNIAHCLVRFMAECNAPYKVRSWFNVDVHFRFDLADEETGETPLDAVIAKAELVEFMLSHLQRSSVAVPQPVQERLLSRAVRHDMDATFEVISRFFRLSGPEYLLKINLKEEALRILKETSEGPYDLSDKEKVLEVLNGPPSTTEPRDDVSRTARDTAVLSAIRNGDFRTLYTMKKGGIDIASDATETILQTAVNCKNRSIVNCLLFLHKAPRTMA
jgi:hypothetical protein